MPDDTIGGFVFPLVTMVTHHVICYSSFFAAPFFSGCAGFAFSGIV